jgi:hypothetical protein
MSVHEKAKMLQESWPPALTILRRYIPVWNQYIQRVIFLYDSTVHTHYKGSTDGHTWKWYTQIISSTYVQRMYMYIHRMNVYMQCMYMVHTKSLAVQAHTEFNQVSRQVFVANTEMPARSWESLASQGWSGMMGSEVWLWSCTDVSVLCTYRYLQSWTCMYNVHT